MAPPVSPTSPRSVVTNRSPLPLQWTPAQAPSARHEGQVDTADDAYAAETTARLQVGLKATASGKASDQEKVAELEAVATQPDLQRVVLPAPAAAPIHRANAAQLLTRLGRAEQGAEKIDGLEAWLQSVHHRKLASPKALATLRALLRADAVPNLPSAGRKRSAAPTRGGRMDAATSASLASPPSRASQNKTMFRGRVVTAQMPAATPAAAPSPGTLQPLTPAAPTRALSLNLASSAPAGACSPSARTRNTEVLSWSAFAQLVSQRQVQAMLELAFLRLGAAWAASRAQQLADDVERRRTEQSVHSGQLQILANLLERQLSTQREQSDGEASVLRFAEKSLQRAARGLVNVDGSEVARRHAELQRQVAEAVAAQADAATKGDDLQRLASTDAALDWLPATANQPATRLHRLELTCGEVAALPSTHAATVAASRRARARAETNDLAGQYGRLRLSARQLTAARQQTERAATATTDATKRQLLEALAARYAAAADAHKQAAGRTGYLQAIYSLHRGNREAMAQAMRLQADHYRDKVAQQRQSMEQLVAHRARMHAGEATEAQDDRTLAALEQAHDAATAEVQSYAIRLGGMAAALKAAQHLERGSGTSTSNGDGTSDAARPTAIAAWAEPADEVVLDQTKLADHLQEQAEAAASWAAAYTDPWLRRANEAADGLQIGGQTFGRLAGDFAGVAEGAGQEVAELAGAAREQAFAALAQAQSATEGLCERLRALLRAG